MPLRGLKRKRSNNGLSRCCSEFVYLFFGCQANDNRLLVAYRRIRRPSAKPPKANKQSVEGSGKNVT